MSLYNVKPSGFNQTALFAFENDFDEIAGFEWINQYWTLSLWVSAVYVILVFAGSRFMNSRPPYGLRSVMTVWSAVNAVFSTMGTIRMTPELIFVIQHYGWEYSICNPSYFLGPTKAWGYLYTISKLFELGDTAFIILRKQKLIFLHWYHHFTVMIYTWYSFTEWQALGRWFMVMNFAVHSVMYSYYAFKAMRFRVPKLVAITITVLQLLQVRNYLRLCFKHADYVAKFH